MRYLTIIKLIINTSMLALNKSCEILFITEREIDVT